MMDSHKDEGFPPVNAGHSASEDARKRAYDPAIHHLRKKMDARVKPAHDGVC